LKRSNRLVLLIGVFLAIVAFVGILVTMQGGPSDDPANQPPPTELPTVVAAADIPLGSRIQAEDLELQTLAVDARNAGAFQDTSQVVGQIARTAVTDGQQVTTATLEGATSTIEDIDCPATLVCMAVQVDQVSGVGTLTKAGDYVDMVVGLTGAAFPVITTNPDDDTFTVVAGLNSTSVKVLIQGVQVVGTLLPPPPTDENGQPIEGDTALTGQQQIVILAATHQQSEIIKFSQIDGSITLTLRSADDFLDPVTGEPIPGGPVPVTTSGIILKSLVDTYGVLAPELIETVLPAQDAGTNP
jgi:Flp pilus assembly protein CpaB